MTTHKRKNDWAFTIGIFYLVLLILFAIFGPHIHHDYADKIGKPHLPPSGFCWLGTDEQGRDVFARLAQGARLSLTIGIIVETIALSIGITFGVIGVYGSKWVKEPLMRFTDGMFAFPDILLAILIIGVWETGFIPVIVALSITAWPSITRLVKNQIESLRDREYVVSARALGASVPYLIVRHILPQLWGLILAITIVNLASVILAESSLSFLGIGVTPPEPSWGNMISNARGDMNSHPTLLLWPCLILILTIFALNFVGEGVRYRLDPKSKGKH